MKRINSSERKAQLKSRDPNCTVEEVLGNPVNKFPTDILFLKSTSYQLAALTCTGPSFLQKNGKPFVVVRTNSHTTSTCHIFNQLSTVIRSPLCLLFYWVRHHPEWVGVGWMLPPPIQFCDIQENLFHVQMIYMYDEVSGS